MPFVSYRLLVLFGKSFVIFHIIGIIIIDIVCYYQNKAARAQPQTLPPQHQLQKMLTFFFSSGGDVVFLVSWVSASVHLGSGTKRAEGSALTISVAHCTGTLAHSHQSPPHVSPVAARPAQGQLVPNHFVTLFVLDKYLFAVFEFCKRLLI